MSAPADFTDAEPCTSPIRLVSVIIPTRNRADLLAEQLEAFAAQDYAGSWEIVVVDNQSTDRTPDVVRSFEERIPVRLVSAGNRASIAYARNTGAAAARGDYFIFVDDDDHVLPGWLAAMVRAAERHPVIGGSERWFRTDGEGGASNAVSETTALDGAFGFLPIVSGSNGGVTRELYERVGGFSEAYRRCEDIDFFWRAQLASGSRAHFVEDAVLEYRLRVGVRAIYRQAFADASDAPQLYRRFRAEGMPPDHKATLLGLFRTVRYGPRWMSSERGRQELAKEAGWVVGRPVGALRARVLYL